MVTLREIDILVAEYGVRRIAFEQPKALFGLSLPFSSFLFMESPPVDVDSLCIGGSFLSIVLEGGDCVE